MESADRLLTLLPLMDIVQLREQWFLHFNKEASEKLSAKLLRLAIAYRVQELDQEMTARCDAIRRIARGQAGVQEVTGFGSAQQMKPGTRMLREYKGKVHEVLAVKNGLFVHEGHIYKSLSEVARKIVGKPRPGTVFFGLRAKRRRDGSG